MAVQEFGNGQNEVSLVNVGVPSALCDDPTSTLFAMERPVSPPSLFRSINLEIV